MEMDNLGAGDRAKLAVIGGMIANEPEYYAPDIDDAIAATTRVGAPAFAPTREQRAERVQAIQQSGGQTLAAAKPKQTRAQALTKLEAKLEKMPEEDRIEYVAGRERSEAAQELVDEAYMTVSVRTSVDDGFTVSEAEFEDEDVSDIVGENEDASYADLLGSFHEEEAA